MVAHPWITRFPWCRMFGWGGALRMPPGWYESAGRTRYTRGLRYRHILVDQETLIRFMAEIWGTEVSERELNVFEFYGLLIPARKAIVDDLCPPARDVTSGKTTTFHSAKLQWEYREVVRSSASRELAGDDPDAADTRPLDLTDPDEYIGSNVRPTPVAVVRRESIESPIEDLVVSPSTSCRSKKQWPRAVKPPEPDLAYNTADLLAEGRWLRPTDLAYWQVLGHISPAGAPGGLRDNTRPSVGLDALLANKSAFRLSAKQAERGNHLTTRFYAIGFGEQSSTDSGYGYLFGRLGIGLGQDWYLVALLEKLGARFGAATAADLVIAEQTEKTNTKRAPYEALRDRAEGFREREHLHLPPLNPLFHRDVLLRLAHERWPDRGKAGQSFERLHEASGLTFKTVKRYVQRGGKLLRGELT